MLLPAEMAVAQEFNEVQAVIKPQLNLERARHLRRLIRQRGADLLRQQLMGDDGSVAFDPLAYGEDGIEELEEEPAAEAVGLNLWFDGASTWLEDSHPVRGYEGTQYVLSLGGDRQVTERLVLGAIGVHAGSDVDDIFLPGGSSTRGWGLGPYAAVFLTDTIVLTASAVHTWTDNSLASGGVTAGYDSRDWTLNANVTSYHFAGDWQFAPTAGISYTVEQEDGYVDSSASAYAASTTRTGSVVFGGRISYSHALENGMTVEPSLEGEAEWIFERATTATSSVPPDGSDFDASVTAGIDLQVSDATSLSLTGSIGGLFKPDYLSAGGSARLSVSY